MTRHEFIRCCSLFGLGLPFLSSCDSIIKDNEPLRSADKVLIVGAGAAGLTAAYLLNQKGINATILEANTIYGGRMQRTTTFADFPIPTGAEWLHTDRKILDTIVNNHSITVNTVTKGYNFDKDTALVDGKIASLEKLGFSNDQKFIGTTWFDFFETYIVPSIHRNIILNTRVTSIDYSSDKIIVKTNHNTYTVNRVIITVPVKLLQNNTIRFTPQLPKKTLKALSSITVWEGCKAFIEFSEKFYPTAIGSEGMTKETGHKLFYDAAWGQDTKQHILGLFAVGPAATPYLNNNDMQRIAYILEELDARFENKASKTYKTHIFKNWTTEPFAQGAYVHYFENWKTIQTLGKPIGNKLYFAGDAYTDGTDWSSVHAAVLSAKHTVEALVS